MLTDSEIRTAKPSEKPYKLTDSGGLFLYVTPTGGKLWRLKYRVNGKEKTLSFGSYPAITLKKARDLRDQAKTQLAEGIDPGQLKQEKKAAIAAKTQATEYEIELQKMKERGEALPHTFRWYGERWANTYLSSKTAEHRDRIERRLAKDVYPWLGELPITEVKAQPILACVRRIEARGTIETAHRAKQNISQILRYAIAEGVEITDPCSALTAALKPMPADKHHAAELDPIKIGEILRMIDTYTGNPITRALLKISPYLFQRPGEVRNMKWDHVDINKREWRFNASKTGQEHIVPLSWQVIEILEDLRPLTSKMSEFVFPGMRSTKRPLSETALKAAFERMGINTSEQLTSHGWRAVARTHLDETLGYRPEVIEMQLAHAVRDSLGRAYNRTQYIEQRTEMMQAWANYLDTLRGGTPNP